MEKCSILLFIGEKYFKTTMKYPYIAVRMTKVKKSEYSKGKWDFGAYRNLIPLAIKWYYKF